MIEDRQETRVRLGLGRMRRHLARLGNPQEAYDCIHVAGTNGKGSVCAMFDSILRACYHRTGLYTSPHLHHVRERIMVDGRPIPPRRFAAAMERALRAENRLRRASAGSPARDRLTYFELVTSIAFQYFREEGVRIAVLETGLGGRFDATNVARHPLAAVIPAVDRDHMDFLGDSLSAIAREKAGIFKRGSPAFTAETKPSVLRALRGAARRRGATLQALPRISEWRRVAVDWRRSRQSLRGPGEARVSVGLLGRAQPRNAALVLETLRALRAGGLAVPERAVARGLAEVRWPGRFEVIRDGARRISAEGSARKGGRPARGARTIILDGAHNAQAMSHFRSTLEESPWRNSRKTFLLGMLGDKEHGRMARILSPLLRGQRVVATRPPSPRALEPDVLADEILSVSPSARVSISADPRKALNAWLRGGLGHISPNGLRLGRAQTGFRMASGDRSGVLCVVGSFYLVGAARRLLAGSSI